MLRIALSAGQYRRTETNGTSKKQTEKTDMASVLHVFEGMAVARLTRTLNPCLTTWEGNIHMAVTLKEHPMDDSFS